MLTVQYQGRSELCKYRTATISFDEEDEVKFERIQFLMGIYGWNIDRVDWMGICEVYDRDEYKDFMKDWKDAKHCITLCMKFGL